tara:strand:- start:431 stop:619 length:189 start_codon:yes stop_codon:yes gene_type:complete
MRILSYLSSSNLPLLFSAIKKTKTLSSSSLFFPLFLFSFFSFSFLQETHFQQQQQWIIKARF